MHEIRENVVVHSAREPPVPRGAQRRLRPPPDAAIAIADPADPPGRRSLGRSQSATVKMSRHDFADEPTLGGGHGHVGCSSYAEVRCCHVRLMD